MKRATSADDSARDTFRHVSVDDHGYPRFPLEELSERRRRLLNAAAEADAAGLVLYGRQWKGTAVPWLTEWPTTHEAAVVVTPAEQDLLLVQHHNHLPQAQLLARECIARWGGKFTFITLCAELMSRGLRGKRIGWIGPLEAQHLRLLNEEGFEVVDLSTAYRDMRLVKSAEELRWLRKGAVLSDAGLNSLLGSDLLGRTEWQLGDLIERSYVGDGGTTVIHHLATTSMANPDTPVPRQHRSFRRVEQGDAITAEISAAWHGYPGQVLRTIAVDGDPPPLFKHLHHVADATFEAIMKVLEPGCTVAEVVAASSIIEDEGFAIVDDLVHGFGGGYLPPVLGVGDREQSEVADFAFAEGMTIVVQPNVVTRTWRAGVQTGELVEITTDGARSMHEAPMGFLRSRSA